MIKPATFNFNTSTLIEEALSRYNDLREELDLVDKLVPEHQNIRQIVELALEDAINITTSKVVRPQPELLSSYLKLFIEQEVRELTEFDKEAIDDVLVKPLLEEAVYQLDYITQDYDKYFSIWEIVPGEDYTQCEINYVGDHRIREWHLIKAVPQPLFVNAVRYTFDLYKLNQAAVFPYTEGDVVWSQDVVQKAMDYIVSREDPIMFERLVQELARYSKKTPRQFSLASEAARLIVDWFRAQPNFKKYTEYRTLAEAIYHTKVRGKLQIDLILPTAGGGEEREEILKEIKDIGSIDNSLRHRVGLVYG